MKKTEIDIPVFLTDSLKEDTGSVIGCILPACSSIFRFQVEDYLECELDF